MFETFKKLRAFDRVLLITGFLFALLLLITLALPTVSQNFSSLSTILSQPAGGISFLLLGVYVLRNLKLPQRNLGVLLLLASAFSFIVTAVMIFKRPM